MPIFGAMELQEELSARLGRRVLLHLTDNRRSMVSLRNRSSGLVEVRLQRIFLDSSPEVLGELADLLAGRGSPRRNINRFIEERLSKTARESQEKRPPSPERLASTHHDIVAYARRLNETYLGGRSKALVVWGRRNRTRSRSSIRFGCYDPGRNRITMNRKLDSGTIPGYFVEYILFHEMLHEMLGIDTRSDGRRNIHGRLFKLMESTFPDYEKALRFEKELCRRLGNL